ncbi:MAG TPA: hypothetical protein DIT03_17930 [Candidatus Accumulibacter sp.]|nr:MAG: PEP-CTERM motif protein [Candidatus Accumulibacter sp. SK-11]HCN70072.1 hypothetical protein [Accumulibacter sp.]HCV13948.1 hypothetical protein [Accumulibacter sp.]
MNMNMKMKTVAGMLAVGALVASGSASAAPTLLWEAKDGTISNWSAWGPIVDSVNAPNACPTGFTCTTDASGGDGDTTFALLGGNFGTDSRVTLNEVEDGGEDFYNLDVGRDGQPVITGTRFSYQVSTTDAKGFRQASLDSQLLLPGLGAEVRKEIFDAITGDLLLTLLSVDGSSATGSLARASQNLRIVDTIVSGDVESLTNQVTTAGVPEPATLALFGIGLLGLLGRRRAA